MVRRFILSKDGSVDAGIAQFVKWAMRVVATFFIMQVWFYLVFLYYAKYSSQGHVWFVSCPLLWIRLQLTALNFVSDVLFIFSRAHLILF
jgi:hypothetical protein